MNRRFLAQGLLYIILGVVFVYFTLQQVNLNGWGFFAYVIAGMAAVDFVTGARFIIQGFKKDTPPSDDDN